MGLTAEAMAAKVGAALTTYGRDITVTTAANSYDPATGTNTQTPTNHTVRASPPLEYDRRYVDGNTVREGDVQYIFQDAGLGFTPAQGQKLTDGSRVYRIVSVRTDTYDYFGSTFVAYTVQARGDG